MSWLGGVSWESGSVKKFKSPRLWKNGFFGLKKRVFRSCSKWSQKRGLAVEKHIQIWLSCVHLCSRIVVLHPNRPCSSCSLQVCRKVHFRKQERNCWSCTVYHTKTSAVVTESLKIRSQLPHLLAGPAFADDLGGAEPPFALSALKLARAWAGRPNQETELRNV